MSFYTKNKEGFLVDIPMEKVETLLNNNVKVYSDKDLISELNFQKEKLQEENKILREALEFLLPIGEQMFPKDIPSGLSPMFYYTLDEHEDKKISYKIQRAREALAKVKE